MDIRNKIYSYLENNQVGFTALTLLGFVLLYFYEMDILHPILSLKKIGALMWLAAIFLLRLEATVSLVAGFIFWGLATIMVVLGKRQLADELAILVYLLFVIGTVQRFFEFIKLEGGKRG